MTLWIIGLMFTWGHIGSEEYGKLRIREKLFLVAFWPVYLGAAWAENFDSDKEET